MDFVESGTIKLACVMVGLPARGKTYISQKICRYLQWLGTPCKVFNVGQYRRMTASGYPCNSDFFDPSNLNAAGVRNEAASIALADMLDWFKTSEGTQVAIYDATNTTKSRREYVRSKCIQQNIDVIFIESICNDPEVISSNIADVKLSGPDYINVDSETATRDFKSRINHYMSAYETIDEPSLSYLKLIDVGNLVIINLIRGWLQSRIVYFLMNLHIQPRRILFSRHGESLLNVAGRIGGDSDLSPRGQQYARALPRIIESILADGGGAGGGAGIGVFAGSTTSASCAASNNAIPGLSMNANTLSSTATSPSTSSERLTVWISTLKRTLQTASFMPYPRLAWKALDELDAGVCDGMTYEEIEETYPEDFADRDRDKYNYRYRGGESYHDLVVRLEPVIMELERRRNILIIGHQAILRCIYAYFMNYSADELPYIKIPLHTVISLTPRAYGCIEKRYKADISAVDTHRDTRALSSQLASPQSATTNCSSMSLGSAATGHKSPVDGKLCASQPQLFPLSTVSGPGAITAAAADARQYMSSGQLARIGSEDAPSGGAPLQLLQCNANISNEVEEVSIICTKSSRPSSAENVIRARRQRENKDKEQMQYTPSSGGGSDSDHCEYGICKDVLLGAIGGEAVSNDESSTKSSNYDSEAEAEADSSHGSNSD